VLLIYGFQINHDIDVQNTITIKIKFGIINIQTFQQRSVLAPQ